MFGKFKKQWLSAENLFILGVMLTSMAVICSSTMTGNDFWWHVKVGEWIAQNKSIPRTAIFNWYDPQQAWTPHEWLFELIIYKLYQSIGLKGIYLVIRLASAIAILLILNETKPYIRQSPIKVIVFAAFVANQISNQFYPRPQFLSFFLIFAVLKILNGYDKGEYDKAIWALPAISVLWSNIHGGYALLSYAFPAILLFSHLFSFSYGRIEVERWDKKRLLKLATVTVLCIIGILVNPVGWDVLIYPFVNLFESIQSISIAEWTSPTVKDSSSLVFTFGMILFSLMWMVASKNKIRFWHVMLCLATGYLALRSRRFSALYAIAMTFFSLQYLTADEKPKDESKSANKKVLYALESAVFAVIVAVQTGQYLNQDEKYIIAPNSPPEIVDWVKEAAPERLFNEYSSGTELIFYGCEVFIDARADLYASPKSGMLADCFNLIDWRISHENARSNAETPEEILEFYDFDAFIVRENTPLYYRLLNDEVNYVLSKSCESIYGEEDKKYCFFLRKEQKQ